MESLLQSKKWGRVPPAVILPSVQYISHRPLAEAAAFSPLHVEMPSRRWYSLAGGDDTVMCGTAAVVPTA